MMRRRSAAVTEFDSGNASVARADLPIECRDGDVIDIDRHWEGKRLRRRRGSSRWLYRQRDVSCAQPANGEMAREQRERLPFDGDVGPGQRRIAAAPHEF